MAEPAYDYDFAVIGGGSGGLAAAKVRRSTCLIERRNSCGCAFLSTTAADLRAGGRAARRPHGAVRLCEAVADRHRMGCVVPTCRDD